VGSGPGDAPCWFFEFDLQGRAVREINGSRTTDEVDQVSGGSGTYLRYRGTEAGDPCAGADFEARLTFDATAYRVAGAVVRGFPDPPSLAIEPDEASYVGPLFGIPAGWSVEGADFLLNGMASFWPYELGAVGANAVRIYPSEPARR
jgi:hypothetical protein